MSDNGSNRLDRIEKNLEALTERIDRLVNHVEEGDVFMARMAQAQLMLAENHNKTELQLQGISEKLQEVTEKLDAVIKVVDDIERHRPQA